MPSQLILVSPERIFMAFQCKHGALQLLDSRRIFNTNEDICAANYLGGRLWKLSEQFKE